MTPMPPTRASDRIAVLRATIRGIEQSPASDPVLPRCVASGHRGFDRFLGGGLARGALHDIHARQAGDSAAAMGFALAWAARARATSPERPVIWIGCDQLNWENGLPYGPGLAAHGLDPAALILVRTVTVQDALWALEEALRSAAPAAVIGEFSGSPRAYDLTASRRLLLAAQAGQGVGLLVFAGVGGSAQGATSAATTRFAVAADLSRAQRGAPGCAAWTIDLTKNRTGRTGQFSVEWSHDAIAFSNLGRARPKTLLRHRLPDLADGSTTSTTQPIRRAG